MNNDKLNIDLRRIQQKLESISIDVQNVKKQVERRLEEDANSV